MGVGINLLRLGVLQSLVHLRLRQLHCGVRTQINTIILLFLQRDLNKQVNSSCYRGGYINTNRASGHVVHGTFNPEYKMCVIYI